MEYGIVQIVNKVHLLKILRQSSGILEYNSSCLLSCLHLVSVFVVFPPNLFSFHLYISHICFWLYIFVNALQFNWVMR